MLLKKMMKVELKALTTLLRRNFVRIEQIAGLRGNGILKSKGIVKISQIT
jgi:hypothetical protein